MATTKQPNAAKDSIKGLDKEFQSVTLVGGASVGRNAGFGEASKAPEQLERAPFAERLRAALADRGERVERAEKELRTRMAIFSLYERVAREVQNRVTDNEELDVFDALVKAMGKHQQDLVRAIRGMANAWSSIRLGGHVIIARGTIKKSAAQLPSDVLAKIAAEFPDLVDWNIYVDPLGDEMAHVLSRAFGPLQQSLRSIFMLACSPDRYCHTPAAESDEISYRSTFCRAMFVAGRCIRPD
jgi:hypothetical protein